MPEERLITIARFADPGTADKARGRLTGHGIESFIPEFLEDQFIRTRSAGSPDIRLQVAARDVQKAVAVLTETEARPDLEPGVLPPGQAPVRRVLPPLRCPRCGSEDVGRAIFRGSWWSWLLRILTLTFVVGLQTPDKQCRACGCTWNPDAPRARRPQHRRRRRHKRK